jgi:hypothetical protein
MPNIEKPRIDEKLENISTNPKVFNSFENYFIDLKKNEL